MPRDLASMMRFSIWSDIPSPCRPPIAFAATTSSTRSAYSTPSRATGQPSWNATRTVSGSIATLWSQWATPMIGSHDRHRAVEPLELLRLVGRAPDVRVGRVRLLGRGAVREAALEQPLAHLLAPAELGHELRVEPRLVDAERRVREQAVAEEPLDVVALVRRAVAPDVDAVLVHRVDEHRPGDGAAERRRVEVRLAGARDVEGAALEGDEALVDELRAAVDDLRRLGAVCERALRDVRDVHLVDLAEVGRERVRDPALLADPGDGDGRVEAAREGDPDPLADGQRLEDAAHRRA